MNGSADTNGKAPLNGSGGSRPRPADDPLVKVQPPRREDLQPSYAQVIKVSRHESKRDLNSWLTSPPARHRR